MNKIKKKRELLKTRHKRIRAKVIGTKDCPRFHVFRSNQHIYAQIIDDQQRKTLVSLSDLKAKNKKLTKIEIAKEIGSQIAKQALAKEIKKVVFDRGGYKYHGRVKALAEAARGGGLKF